MINPQSLEAKINLELALRHGAKNTKNSNSEIKTATENKEKSVLKDAVFSIIRENEQNRWKNSESQNQQRDILDY